MSGERPLPPGPGGVLAGPKARIYRLLTPQGRRPRRGLETRLDDPISEAGNLFFQWDFEEVKKHVSHAL